MAKNTRNVKQHEVYILRRHWSTKRAGGSDLRQMQEVAIFDDRDVAEAYLKKCDANPAKEKKVIKETWEVVPQWVELAPEESNYSLPFNPKYQEPEAPVEAKPKRVRGKSE